MKLKRKELLVNDSDEEFSVDSEGFVKNRGEVKSSRSSKSLSNYLEASSDDEFAKEHFILPSASDDEDRSGKKSKQRASFGPGITSFVRKAERKRQGKRKRKRRFR